MAGGASVEELFASMRECAIEGVPVVLRVDPVIPYLTDSKDELRRLVDKAVDCGAKHVIGSVMDIPLKIAKEVIAKFTGFGVGFIYDLEKLYCEVIDGYLHARIDYRKRIFDSLRNLCEARGITFALCMEYELLGGRPVGLNREFMSSTNCEGIDVPVYIRKGDAFVPAAECSGACLTCTDAICGIDDLAMGTCEGKRDFTLSDYRRWSREMEARDG
jgi:hypothetical protein